MFSFTKDIIWVALVYYATTGHGCGVSYAAGREKVKPHLLCMVWVPVWLSLDSA